MTATTECVTIYGLGLVHASACAPRDMPPETVEDQVNMWHPTGIESRWRIDEFGWFNTGETNPCPCEQDEGRQHWLLSC